jgi:DNA invertase Pin-like site-specific DNA recombinase
MTPKASDRFKDKEREQFIAKTARKIALLLDPGNKECIKDAESALEDVEWHFASLSALYVTDSKMRAKLQRLAGAIRAVAAPWNDLRRVGLDAQRSAVAAYLNGGELVAEVTEVESGKRSDRPVLEQALAAARLHRSVLIVAKLDRLTRSVAFLSRLLEANVDLRFVDLPQIEGPTGRFMLQQLAAVAELEAGMISARIKAALVRAKRRGVVLGGDHGNVPSNRVRALAAKAKRERADRRAADVMPSIRALQANGATSLRAIAAGLNERGIPTPNGGTWFAA